MIKRYYLFLAFVFAFLVSPAFAQGVKELADRDFDSLVLKVKGPVIVEFFAPWCPHCKRTAPEYEKAGKELPVNTAYKVNCDNSSLHGTYKITGIPTFIIFKEGKEVSRFSGFRTAADIVAQVEKHVDPVKSGETVETTVKTVERTVTTETTVNPRTDVMKRPEIKTRTKEVITIKPQPVTVRQTENRVHRTEERIKHIK